LNISNNSKSKYQWGIKSLAINSLEDFMPNLHLFLKEHRSFLM